MSLLVVAASGLEASGGSLVMAGANYYVVAGPRKTVRVQAERLKTGGLVGSAGGVNFAVVGPC